MSIVMVIRPHGSAEGFLLCLVMLVGKQAQLGPFGALSLLAADLGDPLLFRGIGSS